jgi:hypothetical protein
MSKIIDLIDGNITIAPECLVIEPFMGIWKADKSKEKVKAMNIIKYVWFFTDFNSPYFQQAETERDRLIREYIIKDKDFKVDKTVQEAMRVYEDINTTPSMRLFKAVQESIVKMETFFKTTDYNEENVAKIQKAILDMPKMQESVQKALENCRKEQSSSVRVRGGASLGMFE